MSTEGELSEQIRSAISRFLERREQGTQTYASARTAAVAEADLDREAQLYRSLMEHEHVLDLRSARKQREDYANRIFILVGAWICALFLILLAQGLNSSWHPFSDAVLIALISSMTINLIGTLVIVLKYIFRDPE